MRPARPVKLQAPALRGLAAAVLALALALLPPAPCAPPALAAVPEQELTAAVPANLPPLFLPGRDGEPRGFAIDVLRRVAARAGCRLRVIATADTAEAMRLVEIGEAQVLPGLGVSSGRAPRFLFTRPFETQPVHIFYRSGAPPLHDLSSLGGHRVSTLADTVTQERLANLPEIRINLANNLPQAIIDLLSGDSDALVFQSELVEHTAKAAGLEGKIERSRKPLFEVGRAFAVIRGQEALRDRLDKALDEYRDTEDFQELYRKWHAPPMQHVLTPLVMWTVAGLFLALGATLLVWRSWSLWRMNKRLLAVLSERDQALAELRLARDRTEALFTLTHMDDADEARLVDFALEQGVRLTGSALGFLAFMEDGGAPGRVHWHLPGRPFESLPGAGPDDPAQGLWAACVESRAPVLLNDAAAMPPAPGLPGGGPVRRFMAVPVEQGGSVAAVLGVADKDAPYDATDVRQLQLFLAGLWRIIGSRRDALSLRRAKEYAEGLIEGANAMIVGLDRQGRVTLFNAAAERITGYSRREILGRHWRETVAPCDPEAPGVEALPGSREGLLRAKDGGQRHISWQNSLLSVDGGTEGRIAFGIDITDQKQAEAELLRLHRAIEQTAEGVLITDGAGVVLYANPAMARMLGVDDPGRQLLGHAVTDMDLEVLEHHSTATQAERPEGTWRGACSFVRAGVATAEIEFAVSTVSGRADQSVSYVAVCRDVTEKRLLEHQLWQAQKMEALGTLAGGIAHDFNNLLASIMGFTELAMDDVPAPSPGRGCLERVLGASQRARELVRQILSFSRRSEHRLRPVRANATVAEALKLLEASLAKDIEIRVELGPETVVLADPSQLHQIVLNLCTNAAQAMQGAGGRLTLRTACAPLAAELAARHRLPQGPYLRLDVEDQGPGIPPDLAGRIFDPFFTTKAPGEGTGLGLAVVHGIVSSLGGAVWAESGPGPGARLSVLLPAHPGLDEAPAPPPPVDLRGSERILVIDDEPDILELCRRTLEALGYRVATSSDPEAALAGLRSGALEADLLVTDLNMPRLNGLALAQELRPERPNLPILIITGLSKAIPPDRLAELAPVRALSKPFSTAELAQAVRQAFGPHKEGEHDPTRSSG